MWLTRLKPGTTLFCNFTGVPLLIIFNPFIRWGRSPAEHQSNCNQLIAIINLLCLTLMSDTKARVICGWIQGLNNKQSVQKFGFYMFKQPLDWSPFLTQKRKLNGKNIKHNHHYFKHLETFHSIVSSQTCTCHPNLETFLLLGLNNIRCGLMLCCNLSAFSKLILIQS